MTPSDCLAAYRSTVAKATFYMQSAFNKNPDGTDVYDADHKSFIIDAAFLKFYIGWESFLESVFCSFLLGEPSITGILIPRCITARDEKHASKILIGTNRYFDWTDADKVRTLSKIFLEEENTIGSNVLTISMELQQLKTIRNAAAHITSTTQTQLDGVASRLLSNQQRNIKVADLITTSLPGSTKTIYEYYKDLLDAAAECICKGSI